MWAVQSAIESGYWLIDTALDYMNEQSVGEGICRSGIEYLIFRLCMKLSCLFSLLYFFRLLNLDFILNYEIHFNGARSLLAVWR